MLRSLSALGLVWLLGCSNSPPPLVEAPVIEANAADWKVPEKPKETDGASKKLFNEMIAANTGGKPDRLEKLATVAYERQGSVRTRNGTYAQASWKGKFAGKTKNYALLDFSAVGGQTLVSVYNSGKGYFGELGQLKNPLDPSGLRDVTNQMAEESCLYLFGFYDPSLVVQTAIIPKLGEKDVIGLHVWSPTIPHALLHLDAKTKRITRIQYQGTEAGTPTLKDIVITAHREIDGFQLPERYTVTANGLLLFDWDKITFEAGATIDPKLFDVP